MAASTYFNQIQQLYIAYFGRPADPVGLAFWAANVDAAGGNVSGVIAGFSASTESGVLYAGASTGQKVSSIYLALFNRNPEPAGLAYWVGQIDSGTVSQAQAAYLIQSSAGPGDATAVANKLAAANAFTAQIDTPAETVGYVGTTAAAFGRAYLNGVDATAGSLANATVPGTLASTVAIATNTTVTSVPVTPSGQTFTLTAGVDNIVGTAQNDTIISSVAGGFDTSDVIDGGAGIDTLIVNNSGGIQSGATVTNVEVASFTAFGTISMNTTSWTGLTDLTATSNNNQSLSIVASAGTAVTATALNRGANIVSVEGGSNVVLAATGSTIGNISVGATFRPTGTVSVSNTSSAAGSTLGTITVNGGSTVKVTQTANNSANTSLTLGVVTVNGSTTTSSVEINNTASANANVSTAGVTVANVVITDGYLGVGAAASKLTDVSITNFTGASIQSNALSKLSLTNGSANISIDNSSALTGGAITRTLALTVNGELGGGLNEQGGQYTTLNMSTTGTASTFGNISASALTTLNIDGTQALTLTSAAGMAALTTVKISGSAGLIVSDLTNSTLTSIDASATSGNVTLKIDGTKTSYSGGSGVDNITLSATPTKVITGGAGTADVLTITGAAAAGLTSSALVSGFEQLTITSPASSIIDVSKFVGVTTVSTGGGANLILNGMVSGDTLQLNSNGNGYTIGGNFSGSNDTLNLKMIDGQGSGVNFTQTGLTAANVENLVVTVTDASRQLSGSFDDSLILLGNGNKTFTVTGNVGMNLIATGVDLNSVDASGLVLPGVHIGGLNWTTGSLTAAQVTIKGSPSGTNNVNFTAANSTVTYTGGSGDDNITAANGKANIINLGNGNNFVDAGTGASTITGGTGFDSVRVGAITGTVTIDFGSGSDSLVLAGIATTATGFVHATGLNTGDTIDFTGAKGAHNNSTQTTLGNKLTGQTTLADYLDAAAATAVTTNAILKWFQFDNNTYIVQDTSANTIFTAGADSIVQLSGNVDLTSASVSAGIVTLGA